MKQIIGMRYIKTAVAVSLCIVIARALHSEYPFFAAIAALISMETTVTNSFITGRNRMLGTLVGAGIGLMFALVQPDNALLCGVGVIIIIHICRAMNWNSSISIAAIVFLAIMMNLNGQSPWLYSIYRIADTLLGIAVALAVNLLLFPYDLARDIIDGEAALRELALQMVRQIFCLREAVDLAPLLHEIVRLETQHALYTSEFRIGKKEDPQMPQIRQKLEIFRELYAHLKMLMRLDGGPCLDAKNSERINALGYEKIPEGCRIKDDLNTVYNYHVGRILDNLDAVSAQ